MLLFTECMNVNSDKDTQYRYNIRYRTIENKKCRSYSFYQCNEVLFTQKNKNSNKNTIHDLHNFTINLEVLVTKTFENHWSSVLYMVMVE